MRVYTKIKILFRVFIFVFLLVLAVVRSNNAQAMFSGIQTVPDNNALIGIDFGADDDKCSVSIWQGVLNPDGTVTRDAGWKVVHCSEGPGDDANNGKSIFANTNSYITGWGWSANTSGGQRAGPDSTPSNTCAYQAYVQFDPITKLPVVGGRHFWGSAYDGLCQEKGYSNENWLHLGDKGHIMADGDKVIVGIRLNLADDANVDSLTITQRENTGVTTIRGRVYNTANNQGFGGKTIRTCAEGNGGPGSVVTDNSGNFSWTMQSRKAFCVDNMNDPIPGFTGPTLAPDYPGNPNEPDVYTDQFSAMANGGRDRASDVGYDFKYTPTGGSTPTPGGSPTPTPSGGSTPTPSGSSTPPPTPTPSGGLAIGGRVYDQDSGVGFGGVTIDTCRGHVLTDTNGYWSLPIGVRVSYCSRVLSGIPAGYAFSGDNNVPAHKDSGSYEWQLSSYNCAVQPGCNPFEVSADRNTDSTIDFRYRSTTGTLYGRIINDKDSSGGWTAGDIIIRKSGAANCSSGVEEERSGFYITYSGPTSGTIYPDRCSMPPDSAGPSYLISLAPGTYTVDVVTPGWRKVDPTSSRQIAILNGQRTTQHFYVSESTLTVTLSADRLNGPDPLSVSLTADVSGNATGTINYSFWYNCNNSSTSVSVTAAACGALPAPAAGTCLGNAVGYKCEAITTDPKTIPAHIYTPAGTYVAKVITERGGAAPSEDRKTIEVTDGGTLTVLVTTIPNSGIQSVESTITATVGGTATGTINYNFWYNCTSPTTDLAVARTACGNLLIPSIGECLETPDVGYKCDGVTDNPESVIHIYNYTGTINPKTYTAKVIVERGDSPNAESRAIVDVLRDNAPTISRITVTQPDYCTSGPAANIAWVYADEDNDPEGADPQSAYRVEVLRGTTVVHDTGIVNSNSQSYLVPEGILQFATTYFARVTVWDSYGVVSAPRTSSNFRTPLHPYPQVDFSYLPSRPQTNRPIIFTDQSTIYDGLPPEAPQHRYTWDFGDGSSLATGLEVQHTYTASGSYEVTETVRDKDGYICNAKKNINLSRRAPPPDFREVKPF